MRFGLLAIAFCLVAADAPDPVVNGKSLAGWDYLPAHWKVEEGMIVGHTDGSLKFNTFLCSKKKFKDFEMSCKVRLTGEKANSGIQVRSEVTDAQKWVVKGPQADMGDKYWGSLYGEQFGGMMKQAPEDVVKKVLKADDFNDYYIKCVGKHVTIKLNGETTVDDDFEKLPEEGIIAWQLHGVDEVSPREALDLYERNWRHVDRAALTESEAALIDALSREIGGGRLLV